VGYIVVEGTVGVVFTQMARGNKATERAASYDRVLDAVLSTIAELIVGAESDTGFFVDLRI
jgi:hypothetical protein